MYKLFTYTMKLNQLLHCKKWPVAVFLKCVIWKKQKERKFKVELNFLFYNNLFMSAEFISMGLTRLIVKIYPKKGQISSICLIIIRYFAKHLKLKAQTFSKFPFYIYFSGFNDHIFEFFIWMSKEIVIESGSTASMLSFLKFYSGRFPLNRACGWPCFCVKSLRQDWGIKVQRCTSDKGSKPLHDSVVPESAKSSKTPAADEVIKALVAICLL